MPLMLCDTTIAYRKPNNGCDMWVMSLYVKQGQNMEHQCIHCNRTALRSASLCFRLDCISIFNGINNFCVYNPACCDQFILKKSILFIAVNYFLLKSQSPGPFHVMRTPTPTNLYNSNLIWAYLSHIIYV